MDEKIRCKIEAALDAADLMYREFMEPTCSVKEQIAIYKTANTKIRAARKAIAST